MGFLQNRLDKLMQDPDVQRKMTLGLMDNLISNIASLTDDFCSLDPEENQSAIFDFYSRLYKLWNASLSCFNKMTDVLDLDYLPEELMNG